MHVFSSIGMYVLAAFAEIAGCFAFWAWLRLDRSALWLIPGGISLAVFVSATPIRARDRQDRHIHARITCHLRVPVPVPPRDVRI